MCKTGPIESKLVFYFVAMINENAAFFFTSKLKKIFLYA